MITPKKQFCIASSKCMVAGYDKKTKIVKFYFARFDSVDSYGRIPSKTAFNRTIKNNAKKWSWLREHTNNDVIGKVLEAGTDGKGAWVRAQILDTSAGRDASILYDEGVYIYHSFGYYIIASHFDTINGKQVEVVDEAKVVEVSTVLDPANLNATIISLNKSQVEVLTPDASPAPVTGSPDDKDMTSKDKEDIINFIKEF